MTDSREVKALRNMAWERAKGELRGMLCTYTDSISYKSMKQAFNEFIEKVEDGSLEE
jgi:hypothetical protein